MPSFLVHHFNVCQVHQFVATKIQVLLFTGVSCDRLIQGRLGTLLRSVLLAFLERLHLFLQLRSIDFPIIEVIYYKLQLLQLEKPAP